VSFLPLHYEMQQLSLLKRKAIEKLRFNECRAGQKLKMTVLAQTIAAVGLFN